MMDMMDTNGICYIVGAAPFDEPLPPLGAEDFLIAADGGRKTLLARGLTPHLTVGDFDSGEAPTEGEEPYIRFPVEKDDTDTALAVKEGMRRGYRYFMLYGGVGDIDHTLANVQTLHRMAKEGLHGYLVGGGYVCTVLMEGSMRFCPKGRVSVFSLTDESVGVFERGLAYALEDARLTNDTPLGVSNHGKGEPAEIGLSRGALLIAWQAE